MWSTWRMCSETVSWALAAAARSSSLAIDGSPIEKSTGPGASRMGPQNWSSPPLWVQGLVETNRIKAAKPKAETRRSGAINLDLDRGAELRGIGNVSGTAGAGTGPVVTVRADDPGGCGKWNCGTYDPAGRSMRSSVSCWGS